MHPETIARFHSQPINDPQHWRDRASKARDIAKGMHDLSAKKGMSKLATSYDRLAEQAEMPNRKKS